MGNEQKGRWQETMHLDCDEVLDRVSASVALMAGAPKDPRIERHLSACSDCRDATAFMLRLARARPVPPRNLPALVLERVLQESRGIAKGGWGRTALAAAAVLVLTFGTGLVTQNLGLTAGSDRPGWELAFDASELGWAEEEWIVAGAPYLEGVSDETLMALLAEEGF